MSAVIGFFWGAIDPQDLLPNGSDEDLERDIIEKIQILGKNRGYMILSVGVSTWHLSLPLVICGV